MRDLTRVAVGKGSCSLLYGSMCIQIGQWPCTHPNSQEEKFKPGSFLWPLLSHKSSAAALCALEPEPERWVSGRKCPHPAKDGCGVLGDLFAEKGLYVGAPPQAFRELWRGPSLLTAPKEGTPACVPCTHASHTCA